MVGVAGADASGAWALEGSFNFWPGCNMRAVASVRPFALINAETFVPVLVAILAKLSPGATVYSPEDVSTVAGAAEAAASAGAVALLPAGSFNFWPSRTVVDDNLLALLSAAT